MTNVLTSLNEGLNIALKNKEVILIGEDIIDPYGGAFKVTKGLSTQFPEQVFSTPIPIGVIIPQPVTTTLWVFINFKKIYAGFFAFI